MKINGKRTESIEMEVTPDELLRGLQQHFGLEMVFNPGNRSYWKWSESGKLLIEMVDISTHGSPRYVESGKAIADNRILKAFILLTELSQLMEDEK